MLVMGKSLSARLVSTLKLFAARSSPSRYALAQFKIASLSLAQGRALVTAMTPKTCLQAA